MPKKKKVTKAEAKASIRRLHKASKRKEKLEVQPAKPIATRELPPQPVQSIPEVHEEVKQEVVAEAEEPEVVEEHHEEKKEPHKQVVIGEAIEFGWNSVKSHLWFFVGIFLFFAVLSFMTAGASSIVTRIVISLFVSGLSLGWIKISVELVNGKAPEFKELFSCFPLLLKYIIAAIVYVCVVAFGLVLFIIPGIIWAVQFGFYPYAIVKDRSGPFTALRRSSHLTAGVKGRLIWFGLVLIGVNLLGLIALGIGLIVTVPLSMIAAAHVFKQLEQQTHSSPQ